MKLEFDKKLHDDVTEDEYSDGIEAVNYVVGKEIDMPIIEPTPVVHNWDGGVSIDSAINVTSFDFTKKYTPDAASLEFFSWVNFIIGTQDNKTPKTHHMIIDHMFKKGRRKEALCHRGFGKSEVISKFLPLYVAYRGELPGFGKVENLVLFSATISQAEEHLMNMRIEYENNEEMQKVLTLVDNKRIKPKNNQLVFDSVYGNRIYIQAKGAGESMRGTKKGKSRPQLLIFDDVMTDEILTSDVARKKLHSWFFSTVTGAVDIAHYKYLVIGTPMTESDLLGQMRVAPNWDTIEIPVAQSFPVPKADIISSWPDRFTQHEIWDKYQEHKQMGAESEFYREYMLQVISDDVRLFKKSMFRHFEYKELKEKFPNMLFFTSMDLAVSRKQSADYTAIITIGVDADKNWFVVKADHGRLNPTQTLDKLFEHVRMYNPLAVGVENAALQQVLDHFMNERMIRENTFFNVVKLKGNSAIKKEVRIAGLHPRFSMGKVWFNKRDTATKVELEHELSMMTREACLAQHDDVADCIIGSTLINLADGTSKRVDELNNDDEVMTFGVDCLTNFIEDVRITGEKEVATFVFENGYEIGMTMNHPILTQRGYVYAGDLLYSDKILRIKKCSNKSNLMDINGLLRNLDIINQQHLLMEKEDGYINTLGKSITEISLKAFKFITKITTKITTKLAISNLFRNLNTLNITEKTGLKREKKTIKNFLTRLGTKLLNGIVAKKVKSGIKNTGANLERKTEDLHETASIVEKRLLPVEKMEMYSALRNAMLDIDEKIEVNTKILYAVYVDQSLNRSKDYLNSALMNVEGKIEFLSIKEIKNFRIEKTYNFEVPETRNYMVNDGLVVHNCLANFTDEDFVFYPGESMGSEIRDSVDEFDLDDYQDSTVF